MIWRFAAGVLVLLLAAAAFPLLRHARELPLPQPPTVRGALDAPGGTELGAGDDILDAAISPDGRELVFVATSNGVPVLWRRALDAERAEPIRGTDGASLPAWKQTGGLVSFFAGGRLRQLSIGDGNVRDLGVAASPGGAAWLPDGSLLYAASDRGPIHRLQNGATADVSTLRQGDVAHRFPAAVGDAGDFLYVAQREDGRRIIRLVRNGGEVELTPTSGHASIVDGLLVHVVDGALTAQRLDADNGALTGPAARLAFDVGVSATGHAFFAASPRVLAWAAAAPRARELAWLDATGARQATLAEPADYWQVRLAPDDGLAAVTMRDPLLRTLDVFVLPAANTSAAARKLSLSLSADSDPVWSPRGDRIVFRTMQGGQPNLVARPPQFSEQADEPILRSELDETASDWRDLLLFHAPGRGTGLDIWELNLAGGTLRPVARGGFNESDARWSPDGDWLAYVSDETGQPEVMVEPWPQDEMKYRVTSAGGTRPRWGRDGRTLFFLRGSTLMQTTLTERGDDATFSSASPIVDLPGVRDYDVAHRSDRLLAVVAAARSQPARAGLIVNWAPAR